MPFENILFAVSSWFAAILIGLISLWAYKRKDPMHFWSGSTIKPEEISDIPAYNRANGRMWAVYALGWVLSGISALFSIRIGFVLMMLLGMPGVVVLLVVHKQIYKRYKR